jgi:hypothetical protein
VALMVMLVLLLCGCGYFCAMASKKRAKQQMLDNCADRESLHNGLLIE